MQDTQSPMSRQKESANDNSSKFMKYFVYLYALGGALSLVANLTKADVSIVLYLFLYVASVYFPHQKVMGLYLLTFSLIVDVFWMIFVHIKVYESDSYFKVVPWEVSIRRWTVYTVIANMGVKIIVGAGLIFCDKKDTPRHLQPAN